MRSKTNHLVRLVANFLLWIAGVFFLLGALVYLTKALPAAIAMLALALLLMPFTWRKIRRLNPKTLGRLSRIGLAFVVFIAAMVLTPPSLETSEPSPSQSWQALPLARKFTQHLLRPNLR